MRLVSHLRVPFFVNSKIVLFEDKEFLLQEMDDATDSVPIQDFPSFEDSTTIDQKVTQSLHCIETSLQWYDHIACAFLMYESPQEAYQTIRQLQKSYSEKNKNWHQVVLRPLFEKSSPPNVSRKLVEALYLLKYSLLLKLLNIPVHSIEAIDSLRVKYFYKIDSMSTDDAKDWANKIICDVGCEPIGTDNTSLPWNIELQCLKWIDRGVNIPEKYFMLSKPTVVATRQPELNKGSLPKYEINHGLCIIINQMEFYESPTYKAKLGLPYRFGSDVDRDRLQETFLMLGHDVEIHENLDIVRLTQVIKSIAKYDLKKYDGLVICILSHGDKGVIYTSDSIPVSLEQIKVHFDGNNCRDLRQKPKLFFLQACQGQARQISTDDEYETDGSFGNQKVPNFSDFFEAWATVPGYLSFRSTRFGAVFVRKLCSIFQEYGHTEGLTDLMTRVNGEVSSIDTANIVQMPCNSNCLTRGVQLKRNEDKFVEAIIKKLERKLLERAIESAAATLLKNDPDTAKMMLLQYAFKQNA